MTEQEWLTSTDPAAMLRTFAGIDGDDFNRRRFNMDRKLRLFSCACKLETSTSVLGTAYAEMLVDGNAPEILREFHDPLRLAQIWCDWDGLEFLAPDPISRRMVPKPVRADLLRHIVGNPWRPAGSKKCRRCKGDGKAHGSDRPFEWSADVDYGKCVVCKGNGWIQEFQPEHRTPLVLDLAQQLYDGNQGVAPVLHDALLDEGLPPESDLVRHFWGREADCFVCRTHGLGNPCPHCINGEYATDVNGDIVYCDACDRTGKVGGRHPKGCWALDLILGKE